MMQHQQQHKKKKKKKVKQNTWLSRRTNDLYTTKKCQWWHTDTLHTYMCTSTLSIYTLSVLKKKQTRWYTNNFLNINSLHVRHYNGRPCVPYFITPLVKPIYGNTVGEPKYLLPPLYVSVLSTLTKSQTMSVEHSLAAALCTVITWLSCDHVLRPDLLWTCCSRDGPLHPPVRSSDLTTETLASSRSAHIQHEMITW